MRSTVPSEMIWRRGRIPVTCAAYTAVELAIGPHGGDVIDRALRSRTATLQQMWDALAAMPHRRGNQQRRRLLHDSRDEPWSELEREGHRLFRRRRLKGWRTNVPVSTAGGDYAVDVLFHRYRLIIEFDGYEFHSAPDAFEKDRKRRNDLVLAGYTVLNFTWAQVFNDPNWVAACVQQAISMSPEFGAQAL